MNEMFEQSKEFVSTNQEKISGGIANQRDYSLRPPFDVDDQLQILATYKANHRKQIVNAVPRSKKRIPPREFEINPNMKTMYQYHFNDTADARLGYCEQRSIESRNVYFKRCQQHEKNLVELGKFNMTPPPPRKYRSDWNQRISEYAAEISYVGSMFIRNRIHDHSSCGRLAKNCVHYIEF